MALRATSEVETAFMFATYRSQLLIIRQVDGSRHRVHEYAKTGPSWAKDQSMPPSPLHRSIPSTHLIRGRHGASPLEGRGRLAGPLVLSPALPLLR
jgi:hypothetical protein